MTDVDHTAANPVAKLYRAFENGDGQGMQECYAAHATFRDPVFTLDGAERIGGMWKMLLEQGTDLVVEVPRTDAGDTAGSAHWEARYTFSSTGRKVHNVIDASFVLEDGLIIEHVDRFSFWRWSRQALGPAGLALGWTPMVRGKVQRTAARSLDRFLASS